MPSLRARVARRGFASVVAGVRSVRNRLTGPIEDEIDPAIAQLGVTVVRSGLDRLTMFSRVARGVSEVEAVGTPVPSWWFTPDEPTQGRVVLYLHGGAYVAGSHSSHRALVSRLADLAGAAVLLPEYRLAPEHVFPAAVEDAVASLRWLLDSGSRPDDIVIAGDSAGGGLAVATAVAARDEGLPRVAGLVCLSPWTDLTATGESIVVNAARDVWIEGNLIGPGGRLYAPETPDHPHASPLFADLAGLPPMLVHVGSDEVLLDDALRLVDRARAAGVDASVGVFDGMWHVFQAIPGLPEGARSLRECGAFVRRVTTEPASVAGP